MNLPKLYQILAFSVFLTACDQSVNQDTLTVYTSRQPQLIEPILDKYSEATGIDICLLYTSPSPRDVRSSRMPSSA